MRIVLTVLTLALLQLSSGVGHSQNILTNPGFESGTMGWTYFTNGTGGFTPAPPGFEGSTAAKMTVTTAGNNMQLYQTGFSLKVNTSYTLSFAAYSSTARDFSVTVQRHTSPYTTYGLNNAVVNLGGGWNTHTLVFTTTGFSGTTTDTRIRFALNPFGTAGDIYFLDNVVLRETAVSGTPPAITVDPSNQSISSGATATFNVSATGTAPLSFQWQKNGVHIGGATSSSHTTPPASLADNGSLYRCIVSNGFGADTSSAATLSVSDQPATITQHPQNRSVTVGQTASFSVSATGTLPIQYQWQREGITIGGATSSSYTTPATILADNGTSFRCIVSNGTGSDTSNAGMLTVTNPPPPSPSLLNNPGFESGTTGWTYFTNGTGNYSVVQPGFEGNSAARLTVTTTGNNMQLYQTGFSLKANTSYTLSFAAYSSTGRNFGVTIQRHSAPNTAYGLNNVVADLGTVWNTHTMVFTTTGFSGTVTDTRLRFFLNSHAAAGDIYFVDNVVLRETAVSGTPPAITVDPSNQSISSGATATFNVSATGTAPLSFQWQKNGVHIGGATSSSHTTPPASLADNGSLYRCIVNNGFGADTSSAATLSVSDQPATITQHPQNRSVTVGQTASFSVSATGTLPIQYQWQREGITIGGATSSSYTTPATILADNGTSFRCIVSNGTGSDTSNAGMLTVTNPPPPSPSLLNNPGFESGTTGWTYFTNGTGNYSVVQPGFEGNNAARLTVTTTGNNMQLYQTGFSLKANTSYTLSFAAYSSTGRNFGVTIQRHSAPNTAYGLNNAVADLGTVWNTHTMVFTTTGFSGTVTDTRLRFFLNSHAAAGDIYFVDNVVLRETVVSGTPPAITVWYGKNQRFGELGNPVPAINVLGNVSDADGVSSLHYRLNGGGLVPLSRGPDTRRLLRPGDFNIDIPYANLLSGPNQVIIRAIDTKGSTALDTVTVDYTQGISWQLPDTITWNQGAGIQASAQIVDGLWSIQSGFLRPAELGYDRLIAIGERTWTDYEVTVPITVHSVDPGGYAFPSNGPGIGLIMRWPGHSDSPPSASGWQPKSGYLPLGALGWYNWRTQGNQLVILGNNLAVLAADNQRQLNLSIPYMFKMRVETPPGQASTYRLKVWEQASPEPVNWDLSGQQSPSDPAAGSLLLVAHHVDASFGTVTVRGLTTGTHPLVTQISGEGVIVRTPDQPEYTDGSEVQITALPAAGWMFTQWSGDTVASVNPLTLTIDTPLIVTAEFVPIVHTITASAGPNGIISPSGGVAVHQGDTMTFSMVPDTGYHVDSVTVDGVSAGPLPSFVFNHVMQDHSISVSYSINTYALHVATNGNGTTQATPPPAAYPHGAVVELLAVPDTLNHFTGWSGDTSSAHNPLLLTMISEKSLTANFSLNSYIINASSDINGSITPGGPVSVVHGGDQLFIITPDSGHHVDSVFVDGSYVGDTVAYEFKNVSGDGHTIVATFARNMYTITAGAGLNGSISPPGTVQVLHGGNRSFAILADSGYHIDSVVVDGINTGAPSNYEFTNVTANGHTIHAAFGNTFTLSIATVGSGSVIADPEVEQYEAGTPVQLIAVPHQFNNFAGWTGDAVSGDNPLTMVVDGDKSITATFEPFTYTISATARENGGIDPSGEVVVQHGGSQLFVITPDNDYHVVDVLVDSVSVGSVTEYEFTNVTSDTHSIEATFAIDTHDLVLTIAGDGSVEKNPDAPVYSHGALVELTATPDQDRFFVGWSGSAGGSQNPLAVVMDTAKSITATFGLPLTISVQPEPVIVRQNESVAFAVVVSGAPPITYQWKRNGVPVQGATDSLFVFPALAADNGAVYRCVVSNAFLSLESDGALLIVTPPVQRVSSGLLAFYNLNEGSGLTVHDVSGFGTPLNLGIGNQTAVGWISGGLTVSSSTLIASPGAASKIIAACRATNETTIEAWMKPANITQMGPARVVSISADPNNRNVTLGQGLFGSQPTSLIDGRVRTTTTNPNGQPEVWTPAGSLTTALTHVVYTRASNGDTRIYLNGQLSAGSSIPGTLSNWNTGYRLALANEMTGDRPWLGNLHLAAFYSRSLTDGEVTKNFNAGSESGAPPSILVQPGNQLIAAGQQASFTVSAIGESPLFYQWKRNGVHIPGENGTSYTTPPQTESDSGSIIRCVVYNAWGVDSTQQALLSVGDLPPTITQHPANKVLTEDQVATFTITATGSSPLLYQWQRNNIDIVGAFAPSFEIPPASFSDNGATFRCIVTNFAGADTSNAATLTVGSTTLTIGPWERHVIDNARPSQAVFVAAGDVNGDGFKDVVAGAWWYQNPGTPGGIWTRSVIGAPMTNMASVFDFDGDGDLDIVGTAVDFMQNFAADTIPFVWARNNGAGNFSILNNIQPGWGNFLQGATVDRLQPGGQLKLILSWQNKAVGVQTMTIPSDPAATTWQRATIFPASQGEAVNSGDVDRDGDNDLLLGTRWIRNNGPLWTEFPAHVSAAEVDRSKLVDMNGDARLDAVVGYQAESVPGKLAWYEQGISSTDPWTEHIIASVIGPMSMDVADIDADGDIDVLVGEHNLANPSTARMLVFENLDGLGTTWVQHLVYTGDEHYDGSLPVDIDGDGDLDIVSTGWGHTNVIVYENKAIDGIVPVIPPSVSEHPTHQVAASATSATFSVRAEGTAPIVYQWQRGAVDIPGATGSSYITPLLTGNDHGSTYRCRVTNLAGTVFTQSATLVVTGTTPSPVNWLFLSSATGDLPPPNTNGNQQTASLVLDIDKDGTNDFVIADRRATPSLVWYRRHAAGWDVYTIDTERLDIEAGGAFHDIDADGDLDVVLGGDAVSNAIWWWENPHPLHDPGIPWTRRAIKESDGTHHHDQMFGDFNNDGTVDLVFWMLQPHRKLCLASIPPDPRNAGPWPYTVIFQNNVISEGLAQIDVDGDGLADIVGAGRWFKYQAGLQFIPEVIDSLQTYTRAAAAQLIPGGRPEVVFNSGDGTGTLSWYQWSEAGWQRNDLLPSSIRNGHSLAIGDIDMDDRLDIFAAEMTLNNGDSARAHIFYGDGTGSFSISIISTGFDNHESRLADLDGDGDLDILSKPYNAGVPNVAVWLNNGTTPLLLPFDNWQKHVITPTVPARSVFVKYGDIDGDGLLDIIAGGSWYKNPGTPGGTWSRQLIGSPVNQMAAVFDFDGDADLDILGTQGIGSATNGDFAWARNEGGGVFTILTNIESGNGPFLQGCVVGRFRPDSALQVMLSWNGAVGGIQTLTVPADPSNGTWSLTQTSPLSLGEDLDHGDIDGDGDADILLGTQWLRNDISAWVAVGIDTPASGQADRVRLADMDKDGDLDAVVGFGHDPEGKLVWYENPGGPAGSWTLHMIMAIPNATIATHGIQSISVVDIDRDGDLDVVAGEHNNPRAGNEVLVICENVSGDGITWSTTVIDMGEEHHDGALAVDIDADGDLDIVSLGWLNTRLLLYENRAITSPVLAAGPSDQNAGQPADPDGQADDVPTEFALIQNFPNPFNPTTTIRYDIPHQTMVTLTVYNILGQEVTRLVHGVHQAGRYSVQFDGRRMANGVYFYRLQSPGYVQTMKFLLMK